MADIWSKKKRSEVMSRIRGSNTKPEVKLRKALFALGYRYRINVKDLPGKPDIVFPKYKVVVFVNGCFWHGHKGCKDFVWPKTRKKWWREKIEATRERDNKKARELRKLGWKVVTVWECETKSKEPLSHAVGSILDSLGVFMNTGNSNFYVEMSAEF